MQILFDATNIINQPTGAGVYAFNILKNIEKIKNHHNISVLVRKDLSEENELFSLSFNFIKKDIPTLGLKREMKLSKFLCDNKNKYGLFFTFMPYLSLKKICINSIITIHDLAFLRYSHTTKSFFHKLYFRLLMKNSIRRAKHIFTVSNSTKQDIKDFFEVADNKISIVYPDSNIEKNELNINIKKDEKYFLFVGERREHKNIENMLEAFANFKKEDRQDFRFILVGRDYDKKYRSKLEKKAKKMGLEDSVVFLESTAKEKLFNLYNSAFALLAVSSYEGFGIPILEAMRMYLPVITSSVYSMPEVGGEAVLYSQPEDVASITKNMIKLTCDNELYKNLVEKGKKQAKRFSWQNSADEILDYLNKYEQF